MTLNHSGWICCLLAGGFLCGCSEQPSPSPIVRDQSGIRKRPRKVREPAAKRSKPAAEQSSSRQGAKSESEQDAAANAADPNDVFVIGGNVDTVELAGPAPKTRTTDEFLMLAPKPGESSSTFGIVSHPPNAVTSSRPPNPSLRLAPGFQVVPGSDYREGGFPNHILCERNGSLMALVPAGKFVFGSNVGPQTSQPELSLHLDMYYIDVAEVSVKQYNAYRQELKRQDKRLPTRPLNHADSPDHPVLGVNWGEARSYARWLGKDLPTELEWEKAARGPDGFAAPWGNDRAVWSRSRRPEQIDAVESFPTDQSIYGVFDLSGNAREWCIDGYSETSHLQLSRASPQLTRNWTGPRQVTNERVVKGNGPNWASWHRQPTDMRQHAADIGFRCVLRVPPPP